jgi:hypothetical protein
MSAIIFKVSGERKYLTPIIVTDHPPTAVGQFVRIDGQLFSIGGSSIAPEAKSRSEVPKQNRTGRTWIS